MGGSREYTLVGSPVFEIIYIYICDYIYIYVIIYIYLLLGAWTKKIDSKRVLDRSTHRRVSQSQAQGRELRQLAVLMRLLRIVRPEKWLILNKGWVPRSTS